MEPVAGHEVLRVRADNPGPLTLSGTNTWVVGRDPAWVVDPGPLLASTSSALDEAIDDRGGLGGVGAHARRTATTPRPSPPCANAIRRRSRPRRTRRAGADVELADGVRFGPLEAVATPGHAPDHFALVAGERVLHRRRGAGRRQRLHQPRTPARCPATCARSTRLRMRDDFNVICPGPRASRVGRRTRRLEEYIAHRLDREHAADRRARRGPAHRRGAARRGLVGRVRRSCARLATVTLAAHLDKLEEEDILPRGVERPRLRRTCKW